MCVYAVPKKKGLCLLHAPVLAIQIFIRPWFQLELLLPHVTAAATTAAAGNTPSVVVGLAAVAFGFLAIKAGENGIGRILLVVLFDHDK